MVSPGAMWVPAALRFLKGAATKTSKVVRTKLAEVGRPFQRELQAIPVRSGYSGRQQIHPAAFLKQQKRAVRWISSDTTQNLGRVLRRFITTTECAPGPRFDRTKLPSSKTSRRIALSSGRAPFASTLRPNLTGGAMPRSAGGYSLGGGGGARYFSHTPAAPAQVVQNVSQAMRAFFLSGQKIRYDGVGPRGEHQYRAVSCLEDSAMRKFSATPCWSPGSFIDFQISPTVTAMSPLAVAIIRDANTSGLVASTTTHTTCLDTEGFLHVLSMDFGRALKDLAVVHSDLCRLSALGSLPTLLEKRDTIRVRFPGVDAITVEKLCDDLGIQRGIVGQDPGFDASLGVAVDLKFPFAPQSERTISSPGGSARSVEGSFLQDAESFLDNDLFVEDGFDYYRGTEDFAVPFDPEDYGTMSPPDGSEAHTCDEYDGFEGIYRFLEECGRAQGRLG